MERDNRQDALNQLLTIATANGYVTFDDIMRCADDNFLSIGEFDWLSEMAGARNIIIYDEAPKPVSSDDEFDDYALVDYEKTFIEAIEMCPELEPLIDDIRGIMPPQRGEVSRLKYQVQEGNVHARERMTEMYLRLALRIAVSRSKTYDLDLEETVGDAFVGLLLAVDKYDPDHSGSFISFASLWIYQNISREQSTKNPNIYFPVHRKEWFYTMYPLLKERGCTKCAQFFRCKKVVDWICEKIQCRREQAYDLLMASFPSLSLDELIKIEKEDSYFADLISDKSALDMSETISFASLKERLMDALSTLTPREEKVLKLRFGIEDGRSKTLEEVGQKFNVTRERIRQIETKALRKLRHPSRSEKLKDFLN